MFGFYSLKSLFVLLVAVALSMTIHEVGHGLMSYWLGDPTAKVSGRLSLNPLHHIDWVGMFCLMFLGFGWAKPVPIDARYYKDAKSGIIWTSFAGPLANFLLSFVCILLYCALIRFFPSFVFGSVGSMIMDILASTASLSVGFGIFNLIPIPPLDGSKVFWSFLPDRLYYKYMDGAWWMSIVFLLLIFTDILTGPISMLRSTVLDFMLQACRMLFGL